MIRVKAGQRVGAILKADKETVHLLGYGTYDGRHIPDESPFREFEISNPKITLDDGRVVWGFQCWWGDEKSIKEQIGDRKVIDAVIDEAISDE